MNFSRYWMPLDITISSSVLANKLPFTVHIFLQPNLSFVIFISFNLQKVKSSFIDIPLFFSRRLFLKTMFLCSSLMNLMNIGLFLFIWSFPIRCTNLEAEIFTFNLYSTFSWITLFSSLFCLIPYILKFLLLLFCLNCFGFEFDRLVSFFGLPIYC